MFSSAGSHSDFTSPLYSAVLVWPLVLVLLAAYNYPSQAIQYIEIHGLQFKTDIFLKVYLKLNFALYFQL